jgi:hypothetical protein
VRPFVFFHRTSGGLTLDSELVKMSPRLLEFLAGQCQRFTDRVTIRGHQRRISFQEFLPLFAGHV